MKLKYTLKKLINIFTMTSIILILSGCGKTEPVSGYRMCFDTIVSVSLYDSSDKELLDNTLELCDKYELIFSRTNENSELYKLNHSIKTDSDLVLSSDLFSAIKAGYEYSKEFDEFNIALGNVISLWDFRSGNGTVPNQDLIEDALKHCNISNIEILPDNKIHITDSELNLDLGALAKGYIGNELRTYLKNNGCNNAIISLAGNVICLGDNNGKGYVVGIQKPFGKQGETIKTITVKDTCVVTSGTYERYFEENGKKYHHILDPITGFPKETDLLSATIICEDSLTADILSTLVLSMGKEKGTQYIGSLKNVSAILITYEGEIIDINL